MLTYDIDNIYHMWTKTSMAKTYFVANWKMNLPIEGVAHYCSQLVSSTDRKEIIVCPPFPFIKELCGATQGKFKIGAQSSSVFEKGAYTGDVSAALLEAVGCSYCLVGHSERRNYFGETNEEVALKAQLLEKNHITPIICVGETSDQRKTGQTFDVIQQQLVTLSLRTPFLVAYEPVWAIGTGSAATSDQLIEIYKWLAEKMPGVPLLYGGSVSEENIENILEIKMIQGVLVGGAALQSLKFNKIVNTVCR
jgi:triosephosphate isomerase